MKITREDLGLIWHTKTLKEFSDLKFDKILHHNNVLGTEKYITYNKQHIEGFEAKKLHKGHKQATVYFIRTEDIKKLPIIVKNTFKVHDKNKVFNVINEAKSIRITPKQLYSWRQIIKTFAIPDHTNLTDWLNYRMKRLYSRTSGQFYGRYITESSFGKDKCVESYRLLLNESSSISDPTTAKLFYAACHNKDITINELPDKNNKDFITMCNVLMRIGDKSNMVDNRARSTAGTLETADTSKLSVCFTHNIPKYYHDKNKEAWHEIYPYNVFNRFYPVLYEGYLQAKFPDTMNHKALANKYSPFLIAWIKSVLWYEEHWFELKNLYPDVSLEHFTFLKKEERFREHFIGYAKCVSHYAETKEEYLKILKADYESHHKYLDLIKNESNWKRSFATEEQV